MGTLSLLKSSVLGKRVKRAKADLFDGSTTSIFTITGGRIAITALIIEVEDANLDATADNVKLTGNPTTGSSVDLCANLGVASDEQGTIYSLTGTLGDGLAGTTAGAVASMANPIIVNEGTIDLTSSGDSNDGNGARQSVDLFYQIIDDGAAIVAA